MSPKPHILIVDDEPAIRATLETGLSLKGFRVSTAWSGNDAAGLLRKHKFDAVLSDIFMSDGDGLDVARLIRDDAIDVPLILMTAQGSVETAFASIEVGANDFIAKPFEITAVAALLLRHIEARREKQQYPEIDTDDLPERFSASGLVGRSPAMVGVYKLIGFAARTTATVLIVGESGTGKELVARAVHDLSDRSKNKFISVNCSGLTDTLLEAELFGNEKGAFTGADSSRPGLFEASDGGTIFLDELGSTSPGFQMSLLRVLQSGEVRRVGATQNRKVNVRVIGASNADLHHLSELGQFRPDLFYRLSVLTIELPPLREREGDVVLLTNHFLKKIAYGSSPPYLSEEVWSALTKYKFPGNVRELENALVRAVALSNEGLIMLDCFPVPIRKVVTDHPQDSPDGAWSDLVSDRPDLEELQKRYLILTLSETCGNRRKTAERLGIDRRTVQRLIARYGLIVSDPPEDEAE